MPQKNLRMRCVRPYNPGMKTITRPTQTEADIWTGILYPDGILTARAAAAILKLSMKGRATPAHAPTRRQGACGDADAE